ncbi:MAG: L,D-transpeptidase family protein, partial [Methylobacteriaceae bacterium]|nr:L,D-transpeptidase family protein [Methylobacteriaceae bacterium]
RDARGGRIDPVRLSPLVTPKLDLPAAGEVLALTAAAADPGDALLAYQPAYPAYRALRAKLAELRAHRPGSPDPAVSRPRERPEAGARMASVSRIAIIDDVPSFDVAPPASTSLSSPRLEGDLIANMERWRWLPAAVAPRYLIVNIPEFRLRIVENGQVTHEARVITGKPETPTPILSSVMDHAIVNPSWYIPPSILKKEILPGLAADPGYAARRGYEVIRRGNQISVRQPPGERNALGFIKFMFPNQHAVYLHDTPTRNLFGSGRRAFSHGCVRVDQPFALADAVLGAEWSETRLKKLIGRGERTIRLERPVPVHIAGVTLEADIAGGLRSFEDIYGYNRRVRQALGLGG